MTDEKDKLIAELVEVCGWALDALLGIEIVTDKTTSSPLKKFLVIRRMMSGPGACSIRDLRAVIAKATPKPVKTEGLKNEQ